MANAAVVECYGTPGDVFGATAGRDNPHRGQDYKRPAGSKVVAYETCTVVDSDLKSSVLGYSVVARRARDGLFIGWAHLLVGTRPANGTVLQPGDQVGLVAGPNDYHGSAWTGPHIHTTEGPTAGHIYSGTVTDPAPDIAAARGGTAGGGGSTGVVNYHWWQLSKDAMYALQDMCRAAGLYGGAVDGDFGKKSVEATQEILKRWGYLAGDYLVDGIPHNPDQNAPSNYGYALQRFAKAEAGYKGLEDGLPGGLTSTFLVTAANKKKAQLEGTTPPPVVTPPETVRTPDLPVVAEGFVFFPDLASSQGDFDFAEYNSKGGRYVFLKMGGANASDSPYIAPRYKDQHDRARAQQQNIGHYWFNGNKNGLTPLLCAEYFALHSEIKPGDVVAIDIENEKDTGTIAWTPADAVEFITRLRVHFPKINGLIYGSDSLLDDPAWKVVWDLGWEPWDASWGANNGDPGTPPTTSAPVTAWQYTSEEKVPGNYSGNPKVYLRTDGNMAKGDTWARLGYTLPVIDPEPGPDPEPEPEPEPGDDATKQVLKDYLEAEAELASHFAGLLG